MKMAPLQQGHELVEFQDGNFGIRKREGNKDKFLDVKRDAEAYWWPESYAHEYGKASKERVISAYNRFCDMGTVVNGFDQEPEIFTPPKDKRFILWRIMFPRKENK